MLYIVAFHADPLRPNVVVLIGFSSLLKKK